MTGWEGGFDDQFGEVETVMPDQDTLVGLIDEYEQKSIPPTVERWRAALAAHDATTEQGHTMTARRRLVRPTGVLADQKADRDQLDALIAEWIPPSDARHLAHRILNSPWLAAHDAAVTAAALAPIHALADKWDKPDHANYVNVEALRAALGPAAVATHNATIERRAIDWLLGPDVPEDVTVKQLRIIVAVRDRADTLTAHTGDE